MKITLACAAGMSTSMLVQKMLEAAKSKNIDVSIEACPVSELSSHLPTDIILLGPQVSYQKDNVTKNYPEYPVIVIDMMDYGMMNGAKVLDNALAAINK